MFKSWFERIKLLMKSKRKELGLLDDIKTNSYSYGYSTYIIQEKKLDKEYKYLLRERLVNLGENVTTEKMTSVHPTDKGMMIGLTYQEKNQQRQKIWKIPRVVVIVILMPITIGVATDWIVSMLGWNR